MNQFIRHITLTTGHVRDSFADEISPEAIQVCGDLIERMTAGESPAIPGFESFRVSGVSYGRCFVATVWSGKEPIVTIGIATHSRCGAETWRALHQLAAPLPPLSTSVDECPPEPWCAARLEVFAAFYPDVMAWIGDFERCLAWAFVGIKNG
jgi:hypothetical protein